MDPEVKAILQPIWDKLGTLKPTPQPTGPVVATTWDYSTLYTGTADEVMQWLQSPAGTQATGKYGHLRVLLQNDLHLFQKNTIGTPPCHCLNATTAAG